MSIRSASAQLNWCYQIISMIIQFIMHGASLQSRIPQIIWLILVSFSNLSISVIKHHLFFPLVIRLSPIPFHSLFLSIQRGLPDAALPLSPTRFHWTRQLTHSFDIHILNNFWIIGKKESILYSDKSYLVTFLMRQIQFDLKLKMYSRTNEPKSQFQIYAKPNWTKEKQQLPEKLLASLNNTLLGFARK